MNPLHTTKLLNYKKLLSSIALERELVELAEYIDKFDPSVVSSSNGAQKAVGVYNITVAPEATCDGCQ